VNIQPKRATTALAVNVAVLVSAASHVFAQRPDPSLQAIYDRVEFHHPVGELGAHIHDPSIPEQLEDWAMIAVTGKEVSPRYPSGIELWYTEPGGDDWTPGQLLLTQKPAWLLELLPANPGAYWAPAFAEPRRIYYSASHLCPEEFAAEHLDDAPEHDEHDDDQRNGDREDRPHDGDCERVTAIGLMDGTGMPPRMSWTDSGGAITMSVRDVEGLVPSSIDPAYFEDEDGTAYLIYGGGFIYAAELDDLGRVAGPVWCDPTHPAYTHLASPPTRGPFGGGEDEPHWIEAPFMYQRDGWYYLFVNWHGCCNALQSTYEIRVGRSRSPTGPFVDADGVDMIAGGGTLVMDRAGVLIGDPRIIGPGHVAIRDIDNSGGGGGTVMSFHYYNGENEGTPWIGETDLEFVDGWPMVGTLRR
jgi:hypothetical protein